MNDNLLKIGNVVKNAVCCDLCSVSVCVVVFLCWLLNLTAIGLSVLVALVCVELLFCDDPSALFLPIMVSLTCVRDQSAVNSVLLVCWIVPLVACAVVFVCKNFPSKFKLGRMFIPQAAISVALLVGGIGVISSDYYLKEFPLVLALGLGMLVVYFAFVNFLGRTVRDVALHFAKSCVYVELVVCAELGVLILQSELSLSQWSDSYWNFGWGNRGMAATFLPFAAVMCLYLSVRAKKHAFAYVLASYAIMVCLFLTLSRAAIIFGTVAFVAALIFACVRGNRKQTLVTSGCVIVVAALACAVFHQQIAVLAGEIWERFSQIKIYFENGRLVIEGTSGRFGEDALYGQAVQMFKQNPVFGVGMGGHPDVAINDSPDAAARFHSTVFEVMASMGVVGMACYAFYYAMRFREVLCKDNRKNLFSIFTLFTWVAYEGQSLVDMSTFEPIFCIFVALQLAIIEVYGNQENFSVDIVEFLPRITTDVNVNCSTAK